MLRYYKVVLMEVIK